MSYVNNKTHGFNTVASATTFLREDITLTANVPVIGREIAILGMPRLTLWARQSVGANPGQFSIQFSIADVGGNKEWLDLFPPLATPGGTPVLQQVTIPAKFIRVVANRPPGQLTTIEFAIMAAM